MRDILGKGMGDSKEVAVREPSEGSAEKLPHRVLFRTGAGALGESAGWFCLLRALRALLGAGKRSGSVETAYFQEDPPERFFSAFLGMAPARPSDFGDCDESADR